jgi:hypothetical protein
MVVGTPSMPDKGAPLRHRAVDSFAIAKAASASMSEKALNLSCNPRRKTDAIDEFLRQRRPDNAIIVRSSWRDNPWFTPELEEERQLDLKLYPERYDHFWEGEYAKASRVPIS